MSTPTTAPDFIRNETHFDGEKIIGWRFLTREVQRFDSREPFNPTHRETERVGYQVVTEKGIYEFNIAGVGLRATALHPADYEYPEQA